MVSATSESSGVEAPHLYLSQEIHSFGPDRGFQGKAVVEHDTQISLAVPLWRASTVFFCPAEVLV